LLTMDQIAEVPLVGELLSEARQGHPGLPSRRAIYETVRRLIGVQVMDLIETTREQLSETQPQGIDEVRELKRPIAAFSEDMSERHQGLKHFLYHNLYRHYRVHRMTNKAQRVIRELFEALFRDPRLLPPQVRDRMPSGTQAEGARRRARIVADYIAGMTDRYAIAEHERLYDPKRLT
ncbi:MAG: deoxyguanosinetriphosphate triphosphohydrolase, partial [Ectothiorhodospiraceae bacterium]